MNEQQQQQEQQVKGWKRYFDWSNIFYNTSNTTTTMQQKGPSTEKKLLPIEQQDMLKSVPSLINSSSSTISSSSNIDSLEQIVKSSSHLSIHNDNDNNDSIPIKKVINRNPLSRKELNLNKPSSSSSLSQQQQQAAIKKINHHDGVYIKKKHRLNNEKTIQSLSITTKNNKRVVADNIKQTKPKWNQHPNAWGYLHCTNHSPQYLEYRGNERKGYLVGSDSSCDI